MVRRSGFLSLLGRSDQVILCASGYGKFYAMLIGTFFNVMVVLAVGPSCDVSLEVILNALSLRFS